MKAEINPAIFREYDIRGIVGQDLNPNVAEMLGKGIGTLIRSQGKKLLTIGKDNRMSSPELSVALARGLMSTGCDVIDIGMVPTPLLYFSLFHLSPDGGVMITGSHNPPDYNGFKIAVGKSTLYGSKIQNLRETIESGQFHHGEGNLTEKDIAEPYRRLMIDSIDLAKPLRVVVDSGSGTAGPLACKLIKELGCDVTELYCRPDSTYPGHFPDPTIPANLEEAIRAVQERGADLAVAYDGDADRLGVVDDNGRIIWGDQLMIIFSRDILIRKPGASIVFEVKCSQTLEEDILKHGGKPIIWKAGHSLIKQKMKEEGSMLGGEMSGHLFFAEDYYGYDDAIYASLKLLQILSRSEKSISAMLADVPVMASTPEIRIPCPDDEKFKVVQAVLDYYKPRYRTLDVDGARISFSEGWGLVRASNTQPVLVLRFEATNEESLDIIKMEIIGKLKEFPSVQVPADLL